MKGQPKFVTSYMSLWWAGGLGGARQQALCNFPKFQHCSPVQSLQLPSWLFMTFSRPLCIQQRPYPQWLLSVLKS